MNLKNVMQKMIVLPMTACVLFLGMQFSEASRVNPFSNVQTLDISGEAKVAYIDEKTTNFFNSSRPIAEEYVIPDGWQQEKLSFDGVSVEKYTSTTTKTNRIVFFLHGGGYVGGLNNTYRDWGLHKAEIAGNATIFMLDYRLAPQNAYPAALEDAVKAYKGLLEMGYKSEDIILMGDSAGGNLSLALAVYLRDNKISQPKAIVLLSPWTYLGTNLPAHTNNLEKDKILGSKNKFMLTEVSNPSYAKNIDITNPYVSPAYADLTGISPMLIIAGGDELLLDDTALVSAHAKAAGVQVTEKIYLGMSHDWDILLPELPESKAMNEQIAKFINELFK